MLFFLLLLACLTQLFLLLLFVCSTLLLFWCSLLNVIPPLVAICLFDVVTLYLFDPIVPLVAPYLLSVDVVVAPCLMLFLMPLLFMFFA
jgi:hypothetical protein